MKHSPKNSPVWHWIAAPSSYEKASMRMLAHAKALASGEASEAVFITQHKSVYTAGTSAREEDLLNPAGIPTYRSGRGGQWTWHCLLYTSPSPRDATLSRMPSSA